MSAQLTILSTRHCQQCTVVMHYFQYNQQAILIELKSEIKLAGLYSS